LVVAAMLARRSCWRSPATSAWPGSGVGGLPIAVAALGGPGRLGGGRSGLPRRQCAAEGLEPHPGTRPPPPRGGGGWRRRVWPPMSWISMPSTGRTAALSRAAEELEPHRHGGGAADRLSVTRSASWSRRLLPSPFVRWLKLAEHLRELCVRTRQ